MITVVLVLNMNSWINSKAFSSPPFSTALKRIRPQNLLIRLMFNYRIKFEERWGGWDQLLSSCLEVSITPEAVSAHWAHNQTQLHWPGLLWENLSWDDEHTSLPTGGRVASTSDFGHLAVFFHFKKFKNVLFQMFLKTTFKHLKKNFFNLDI